MARFERIDGRLFWSEDDRRRPVVLKIIPPPIVACAALGTGEILPCSLRQCCMPASLHGHHGVTALHCASRLDTLLIQRCGWHDEGWGEAYATTDME